MKKRQLIIALSILAGTLLLLATQAFLKETLCDEKLVQAIEEHYQTQEQLALHWITQEDLWLDIQANGFSCSSAYQLYQVPLPLFLLSKDSIYYWNTTSVVLPEGYSAGLTKQLHQPPDKYYSIISHLLPNDVMAIALIDIGTTISTKSSGGVPLHNREGNAVCYIDQQSPAHFITPCTIWLLIIELCIISGFVLIADYSLTRLLGHNQKKESVVIGAISCFALIIYWIGTLEFPNVSVLDALSGHHIKGLSLLQWISIAVLSVWLLSLLQRINKRYSFHALYPPKFMTFSIYLSINMGIVLMPLLIQHLVKDSNINYDFQNIIRLGYTEIVCLIAILLLLSSHFFYSLWGVRKIHHLGIRRNTRLLLLSLSIVVATSLAFFLNTHLNIILISLVLILFVALIDLFVELNAGSPAWLILWLALLAAFTSGLFFKYQLDVEHHKRRAFARKISMPDDSTLENILSKFPISCSGNCSSLIDSSISSIPYLQKNYRWSIDSSISSSLEEPLHGKWLRQKANSSFINYSLAIEEEEGRSIYIHFTPKLSSSKKTLDKLISSTPYLASDYDFAILHNKQAIAQKGGIDQKQFALSKLQSLAEYRELLSSQSATTYFSSQLEEAYDIIVVEKLGGYLKPISLFSYLFALLAIIILLLFGLNHYTSIFPARPGTQLFGKPSLRHRIQLATIGVTMAAFIFACAVTVVFLQNTWASLQSRQMMEDVGTVMRALSLQSDSVSIDKSQLDFVSKAQQVDISWYSNNGKLIESTSPYLYEQDFKSELLSPEAFFALSQQSFTPNIINETVLGLDYYAATVPIQSPKHKDELQFISITLSSQQEEFKEKMLSFIGYLLNLYVFLLMIASATAIVIARSITNPLSKLDEKLRSFKLGKNRPLEWKSQDEIGQLIAAYNDMIKALDVSTEKLKQSERESAWREMAKQVAHEIKNPLTPMKLSIQYLNYAQRTDPKKARELIEQVSKTLVEQIDGLAHIATAFSNFAKMPKAEMAPFNINETLRSIYQLFLPELTDGFTLEVELPEDEVIIMADQKQLVRVFNNLIKNAQQAIPNDRAGHIKALLSIEQPYAVVEIRDNGSGIPPEVQPNVFQPNFTTKSSGMGLGLAMCKNIIELANGSIYFTTSPNEGTSFFVKLPLHLNV